MLEPKTLDFLKHKNSSKPVKSHRAHSLNSTASRRGSHLSTFSNTMGFDTLNSKYVNPNLLKNPKYIQKQQKKNIFQNFSNLNPEDPEKNFSHQGVLHKNADRLLKMQKISKNMKNNNEAIGTSSIIQRDVGNSTHSTQKHAKRYYSGINNNQYHSQGSEATMQSSYNGSYVDFSRHLQDKHRKKQKKIRENGQNMNSTFSGSIYKSQDIEEENGAQQKVGREILIKHDEIKSPVKVKHSQTENPEDLVNPTKSDQISQSTNTNKNKMKQFNLQDEKQLEEAKKYMQFYGKDKDQRGNVFPQIHQSPDSSPLKNLNQLEDISLPSEAGRLYNYDPNMLDEAQNFCFTQNLDFLDNININDPAIQQLFNDDVLSNSNLDLESFVERNAEYFQHILKNCACFRCKCHGCRCGYKSLKLPFSGQMKTTNRKIFKDTRSHSSYETPSLNHKVYEQFQSKMDRNANDINSNSPLKKMTTHKKDFIQKDLPNMGKHQYQRIPAHPFIGSSAYNNNFIDFKDYQAHLIKWGHVPTTTNGKIAFNSKSNYSKLNEEMQSRSKVQQDTAEEVKNAQKHATLVACHKDDPNTNYKKDFKGKLNKDHYIYSRGQCNDKPTLAINPVKSEDAETASMNQNQFKTTFKRDFNNKTDRQCHARQNNQQLIHYLRFLKQLKQDKANANQIMEDKKYQKGLMYGAK